jgi:hypothetical protein
MCPREQDPGSAIVDQSTFAFMTELEVRKAVRLQYYVSLLGIEIEREGEGEIPDPAGVARQVAEAIRSHLRGTDVIVVESGRPAITILLVNASIHSLPVVIARITEAVSRRTFKVDDREEPVGLAIGGACFPTTATGAEQLLEEAASLAADARRSVGERYRYRLAPSIL